MLHKSLASSSRAAITGAALAAFAGLAVGTVSATTIYSDNFPGSASASLSTTNSSGQAAPPASGPNWTISSNSNDSTGWMANGQSTLDNYAGVGAGLPFTPVAGQIYTLSVGFGPVTAASQGNAGTRPTGGYGYLAVGFVTSTGGYAVHMLDYSPYASDISILANNIESGNGVSNGTLSGFGALGYQGTQGSTVQNLQIILNTSGTNWTLQFSDNGVTAGSPTYTYSTNPDIAYAGIASFNGDGQASNFSLTDVAVPEPATLGLVAMGGLGLLLLKRRRTA